MRAMIKPENKMQTAGQQQPATCPKCRGTGKTKKADGTNQMCFHCRGTGTSTPSGNYSTK